MGKIECAFRIDRQSKNKWRDSDRTTICNATRGIDARRRVIRHRCVSDGSDGASVSNGSGPSLRVRDRVQTEPLPNWRSGSSINLNCPLGYGSMVNSQPI